MAARVLLLCAGVFLFSTQLTVADTRYRVHLLSELRLAASDEMSQDANAKAELVALCASVRKRLSDSEPHALRSRKLNALDAYLAFVQKHSSTTAAPAAVMLYAFTLLTSNDPNYVLTSEKHFKTLADSHTGIERELSHSYFLPYLAASKEADQHGFMERLSELREALQAILPVVRNYDALGDPLAVEVRKTLSQNEEGSLEPVLMLELAHLTLELGESEQAMSLFRQVETRFANTVWARKATRSTRTMQYLKEKGLPLNGRLGIPRGPNDN